ncbi:NAD(P)-dependent oxidoreductase [Cupriavidus pampae]|uniref:Glyoxylate/hydroxypyruvate reductase B n=1 Tax=Cupriavidus pampae TaxID=659251 RepID=A0ABM8WHB7_9BURK|nr:NAD(P)-dependent oxidoreductase [Cupriavidus pampae]CAG9166797.1 Glyoxylate/hydroxypyruvate reductase B [Cupriavidus pampae]
MATVIATDRIHPEAHTQLAQAATFSIRPWREGAGYADDLADADVVVVRNRIPEELFERAPALRAVIRHGVGLDMIPVEAASARGVLVANVPAVNAVAVAEYVLGQMLALSRRFADMDRLMRTASWNESRLIADHGQQLGGKTVAIVGMGEIGRRVAAMCAAGFGMRVLGVHPTRTGTRETHAEYVPLHDALAAADYLVLTCPLTPATKGMIGAAEFARMKPSAFLINVARGAVVERTALHQALQSSQIAGAALDVFETQPLPAGDPLFDCPTARLTPHMAGISTQSLHAMSMGAAAQVIDVLAGRLPPHWVNRDAEPAIRARWAALGITPQTTSQ